MNPIELSDKSHLNIEFASESDLSTIILFINKLAEFEKLENEVKLDPDQLRQNLFGENKFAKVLMARRNGEPVGFALYFNSFSTFLGKPGMYLEDLFVLPQFRSLGIGKHLFARLAQIAVQSGCPRLDWSVLNWNERAIAFYKSLGAKPMDEWTVYRLTGKDLSQLAK